MQLRTIVIRGILLNFMCFHLATCWNIQAIKEIARTLDCIHVYVRDLDHQIFKSLYNLEIPVHLTGGVDVLPKMKSNCPHTLLNIDKMEQLRVVNRNFVTRAGFLFIIFSEEPKWLDVLVGAEQNWISHKIYKVYYVTKEETRFYHPFLINDRGKYGVLVDANKYKINSIFRNLNGYPVRVYLFDSVFSTVDMADYGKQIVTRIKGPDARIGYLLEAMLNFTMVLQWPDDDFFGARLDNGSYSGAIGRMTRDETDLTVTGFFVKDYLTRDMEFSASVYMDKLCCYVIKAKRIPPSILPLYAVHESIWMVYVTVGILSSFVWMLLRRANIRWNNNPEEIAELKKSSHYLRMFADTWVLWVRMIISRFPPSNAERIFTISLCLVSVIIGAIVESSLATVYITPRYYKDINTLEELDNANLKIFYKHAAIRDDLLVGHSSPIYQRLDKKMILVGEPEERLISIMAKRGGFVAVTRASSLELVDIYYFITQKVHLIPECPKLYHIAFLLAKHSPYEEVINVGLLEFLAAGLINHWIDEERFKAKSRIHLFREYVAEIDHKWKVFNIVDLQLAFYVLICGIALSAVLFLLEFIYNTYVQRKKARSL